MTNVYSQRMRPEQLRAALNADIPARALLSVSPVGILANSSTGLGIFFGSGVPTFSAAEGSIYSNTTGAGGARLYVNTSSGSGTTWTAASSP